MAGAGKRSCYCQNDVQSRGSSAAQSGAALKIAGEIIRLRFACAWKIGTLPASRDTPAMLGGRQWGDR